MSSPSPLPIYEIEPALLEAWRSKPERRRLVIEAPTESGKSTQLPQMLSRHGLSGGGEIVILQPRRIAARPSGMGKVPDRPNINIVLHAILVMGFLMGIPH